MNTVYRSRPRPVYDVIEEVYDISNLSVQQLTDIVQAAEKVGMKCVLNSYTELAVFTFVPVLEEAKGNGLEMRV